MSDIFISYAKEDRSRAKDVANRLEQEGWTVFWDRIIPVGATWDDVLEDELGSMKVMVVLWSHISVLSEWVRIEAEEGASRKILVPILLEDVKIPVRFRAYQAADMSDWTASQPDTLGMRQLIDAIARLGHLLPRNEFKADQKKQRGEQERTKNRERLSIEAENQKKQERVRLMKEVSNYFSRAEAKYAQKDYSGAIADYNKVIEIDPNHAEAYDKRGSAKLGQEDYSGALSDYTKAIEINPEFAGVYFNQGLLRYTQQDYYGAIADFTKIIEIDPESSDAYFVRGCAKAELNNKAGACKDWKTAYAKGYKDADRLLKMFCK